MKNEILQTEMRDNGFAESSDNVKRLQIGKWFDVCPASINGELLFGTPMENKQYEWMLMWARQQWQETYIEHVQPFEVFIPEIPNGKWQSMTQEGLYNIAQNLGGYILDVFRLGLLWGQMVTNGQEWKSFLSSNYYMVVRTENFSTMTDLYMVSNNFYGRKSDYKSGTIFDYEGMPFMGIYRSDVMRSYLSISTPIVARDKNIVC